MHSVRKAGRKHFAQSRLKGTLIIIRRGADLREYRGDIQIYRALAVGLVLLFHLGASSFQSGFLGVDIFFVISGYLMQKLHRADHSAAHFYNRRARRLVPAYFATVLATLVGAYFLTLPDAFRQTAEQALYAAPFMSNVGFWFQNSYFAKSEFNPMLHLWSLGVEMQFYLLFPLLAWVCRGRRWLLVTIALVSLALCFALVTISPKTAFFMMPARLWQFALGMLAATVVRKPDPWIGGAAFVGMVAISLIPINGDARSIFTGHPSIAALAISACTALALIFRLPESVVNSGIGRQAQRVGDVSYSLYLAHWPVLVLYLYPPFGGTATSATSWADLATCIVLIALATAVLYLFFEKPGPRFYTFRRAAVAGAVVAVVAIALVPLQLRRFPESEQKIFAAQEDRATYRCGKLFRITHPGASTCQIGEGGKSVLLIGDSHSDSIKESFAKVATEAGYATYFSVANDPLLNGHYSADWLAHEAARVGAETVYLHFSHGNLRADLVSAAQNKLAKAGIATALIAPVPDYRRSVPANLYDHATRSAALQTVTLSEYESRNAKVIRDIADSGVRIVAVAPEMCAPVCRLTDSDLRPLYHDDSHLTLSGARTLEPLFRRELTVAARIADQGGD